MGMQTFYFTFGVSDSFPYKGGWAEVVAHSKEAAIGLFRLRHADRHEGIVNCSDIYTEEQFKQTEMYTNGNFGHRCWERISMYVDFPSI